jgi:hypothetical protein
VDGFIRDFAIQAALINRRTLRREGNRPVADVPLGNWLFISTLALVLFQLLSRIETRAADHALVQLVLAFYFAFHWILL